MDRIEALSLEIEVRYALTSHKHKEAVDLAFAALKEQEQLARNLHDVARGACKWISVKDETPPEGDTEYEVCCDYNGKRRIEIHKGWNMHCVTHWRPLPEMPEGGADHVG